MSLANWFKKLLTPSPKTPQVVLGRNDLCWCGSGKKYKKCHAKSDQLKRVEAGYSAQLTARQKRAGRHRARPSRSIRQGQAAAGEGGRAGGQAVKQSAHGPACLSGPPSEASPPGPLSVTGEGENSKKLTDAFLPPLPVRERGPGGEVSEGRPPPSPMPCLNHPPS